MHKNIADLSDKDILKILRKESPELLVMLPDIEKRLESMDKDIKPYADALHRTPHRCTARRCRPRARRWWTAPCR